MGDMDDDGDMCDIWGMRDTDDIGDMSDIGYMGTLDKNAMGDMGDMAG